MGKTKLMVAGVLLATLTLTACGDKQTGSAVPTGASSSDPGGSGAAGFDSLKSLAEAVSAKSSNAKSSHVTIKGDAAGMAMTGEGDFSFADGDTQMQMTMTTPVGSIEMKLIDRVIYMKLPAEVNPAGKPWIKISADGDDPISKQLAGSMDQITSADPSESLKKIVDAGEITKTEKVELNGEQTTHYVVTVDVTKLSDEAGYDAETRKQLEASGVKEFPMEVWVNGDDLPVRIITSVPVPASAGAGSDTEVSITADYTDWGKAVDIQAPDASEVGTFGN